MRVLPDELAEDASSDEVLGLLDGVDARLPALCTHGEVIEELLPGRPCKQGAIWVVQVRGPEVRPDRYLLPPA
jgi:hypothetical protein